MYQDILKTSSSFTKDAEFYQYISFPGTSIGETDPERHRIRRKVLAPALSGTRIQELAPLIESKSDQLLARFEKTAVQYTSTPAPICITSAAKAFTMDIISKIVLGEEVGCIAEPDFRSELSDNLQAAFSMGWVGPSFPRLSSVALWIAKRVPVSIFPMPHLKFKQVCSLYKLYLRPSVKPSYCNDLDMPTETNLSVFLIELCNYHQEIPRKVWKERLSDRH